MSELTKDVITQVLPGRFAKVITDEMVDQWNVLTSNPDMCNYYRENFISYAKVLTEGKFSVDEYLNAVIYCSHRLTGESCKDSYNATFPTRVMGWITRGINEKAQSSYISAYNNSKLVKRIMEQSVIPLWVLNQDVNQRAINTLIELMDNADSEKVRSDSANALLNHLKKPDSVQVELNVGVKEDSELANLQKAMKELVQAQTYAIQSGGANALAIAESKIVPTEIIEHE